MALLRIRGWSTTDTSFGLAQSFYPSYNITASSVESVLIAIKYKVCNVLTLHGIVHWRHKEQTWWKEVLVPQRTFKFDEGTVIG